MAPPQDFAPNKIVFRLVFRPKLAQTVIAPNFYAIFEKNVGPYLA